MQEQIIDTFAALYHHNDSLDKEVERRGVIRRVAAGGGEVFASGFKRGSGNNPLARVHNHELTFGQRSYDYQR